MTNLQILWYAIVLTFVIFYVLHICFPICHEEYFLGSPIKKKIQLEFNDSDNNDRNITIMIINDSNYKNNNNNSNIIMIIVMIIIIIVKIIITKISIYVISSKYIHF